MVKLLIVDPFPIVCKGMELTFKSSNDISLVGSLNDGDSILTFLRKNDVDVILCDIDLPKLNGITALRLIKKEFPKVKVIIYSAQPEEVYAISAIKAGAAGYLPKSARLDIINEAIMDVHSGFIYLSEKMAALMHAKKGSSKTFYKKLSLREIEVLKLLSSGKRNKEIAEELTINEKTVSTYRARLMKKMNVTNLIDLVNQANNIHLQHSI